MSSHHGVVRPRRGLNEGKSMRFSLTSAGRGALREQDGPLVSEAFVDLGHAQRAGPARYATLNRCAGRARRSPCAVWRLVVGDPSADAPLAR